MKEGIILFFTILFPGALLAQQDGLLLWQEKQPLRWEHFQGTAEPADHIHSAVTYAGIEVAVARVALLSGHIRFKTRAVFDQQRSWVRAAKRDDQLLAHEQLHFDITEVYARKLSLKLNSMNLTARDKASVKRLQKQYQQAQLETQQLYDQESVHGLQSERQEYWRNLINQALKNPGQQLRLQQHYATRTEATAEGILR